MLLKLFVLGTLVEISRSACPDSKDQEIQGLCFKFVAQQMTFGDARNWCHYQNPVGVSYLAYVPDKDTGNNLASHARTTFGPTVKSFWIGLSRNNSSVSLAWDNGLPVVYTNFGTNVANRYFIEKISNAKWETLGDNDKNYFVCSYYPIAIPSSTTASVICQPGAPQTILFAYSNDLDPDDVSYALYYSGLNKELVTYAISRFDLRQPEEIRYFSDYKQADAYVNSHVPDPSLGFNNTATGSDVLDVIEKFYDNTHVSPCGSAVDILSTRYPNTVDISEIVRKVRQNHGIVNFFASTSPSGGTQSRVLFDLSSQTNGVYSIMSESEFFLYSRIMIHQRYPIYAVNPKVSGQGSQLLPPMSVPESADSIMRVVFQSHVPITNVQYIGIHWYNTNNSGNYEEKPAHWDGDKYTNGNMAPRHLEALVYNMTLDYVYSDSEMETMQIRIYSPHPTNYWLPYCD